MMQKIADPFIRRVCWLTIAVIAVLFAWHALSWADRAFQKESATPRAVTARGDLAADEKSTIELFERSRDSVVYVIEGASEARIRLSDGKEYRANLVGASPMHDLAI